MKNCLIEKNACQLQDAATNFSAAVNATQIAQKEIDAILNREKDQLKAIHRMCCIAETLNEFPMGEKQFIVTEFDRENQQRKRIQRLMFYVPRGEHSIAVGMAPGKSNRIGSVQISPEASAKVVDLRPNCRYQMDFAKENLDTNEIKVSLQLTDEDGNKLVNLLSRYPGQWKHGSESGAATIVFYPGQYRPLADRWPTYRNYPGIQVHRTAINDSDPEQRQGLYFWYAFRSNDGSLFLFDRDMHKMPQLCRRMKTKLPALVMPADSLGRSKLTQEFYAKFKHGSNYAFYKTVFGLFDANNSKRP